MIAFLVALGAAAMVGVDAHVTAARPGEIDVAPAPEAVVGQGVTLSGSRLLGAVTAVHGDVATVRLPVNASAHVGDPVRLEARPGGGVDVMPPRATGLAISGEVEVAPALPFCFGGCIGKGGVTTISSAEIVYRAPGIFALRATLAHAALTFAFPSNIAAVDATAGASVDLHMFEVGLGFGAASYNLSNYGATTAFVVDPLVRVGAVDGLSLTITGQLSFVSLQSTYKPSWNATGIFGVIMIPVGERWWLVKRIGFSMDGYGRVDGAVRVLVRGNGRRGSVFALASVGVMGTTFSGTSQTLVGPTFGVGLEVRP